MAIAYLSGTSPASIEPEVLEQLMDCELDFLDKTPKIYEIIQAFRLGMDLKETDLMIASAQGKMFMVTLLIENDLEGKTPYFLQ